MKRLDRTRSTTKRRREQTETTTTSPRELDTEELSKVTGGVWQDDWLAPV